MIMKMVCNLNDLAGPSAMTFLGNIIGLLFIATEISIKSETLAKVLQRRQLKFDKNIFIIQFWYS